MTPGAVREFFDQAVADRRPSIGHLVDLCEENYQRIQRLIPDLQLRDGKRQSIAQPGLELCFDVAEQTPYTSLVSLRCELQSQQLSAAAPALEIGLRIYHDARQVEAVRLSCDGVLCREFASRSGWRTDLPLKWAANLFVAKWLRFELDNDQRF